MGRVRFLALCAVALSVALLTPLSAVATTPAAPFDTNVECLACHDLVTGDGAISKVDFGAGGVDYNACLPCHWVSRHWDHGIGVQCNTPDCHPGFPTRDVFWYSDTYTPYGYFDNSSSIYTSPADLHRIHVNGSWPQTLVVANNYCDSCHAPAACSACHGDSPVHGDHTNGAYPAVSYQQAAGTYNYGTYAAFVAASTCVNASCHSLAAASSGSSDFTPFCGSCHTTRIDMHGYDSIDHTADVSATVDPMGGTCGSCHSMDLLTEHEKTSSSPSGQGCSTCHPTPRDGFGAWTQGCEQGLCHATGSPQEKHLNTAVSHAPAAGNEVCFDCHTGTDLPSVHSAATTTTPTGTYSDCNVCHRPDATVLSNDCTVCHFTFEGHYDGNKHTSTWTLDGCGGSGCHTTRDLMGVHVEQNAAFTCQTCHDSPRPEVGVAIGAGDTACDACHTGVTQDSGHRIVHWADPLLQDATGPHYSYWTGSLGTQPTGDCAGCHVSNLMDEHMGIYDSATGYPIRLPRKDSSGAPLTCATCHESTDATVLSAIVLNETRCEACHAVHGPIPDTHQSSFKDLPETDCSVCHDSDISSEHNGSYTIVTPGGTSLTGCDVCHSYYEGARGATVQAAIGVTNDTRCTACHSTYHGGKEASHTATTTASEDCGRCHDADTAAGVNVEPVHAAAVAGECAVCHDNPTRVPDISVKTAECASCHATLGTDYHRTMDTAHYYADGAGCVGAGCHASQSLPEAHAPYLSRYPGYADTCALCHLNTDPNRIDWSIASADCATCHTVHGDIATIHTTTASQECVDCHETADVRSLHGATQEDSCAFCHNATLDLTGKTTECVSCHAYSPPDPNHYPAAPHEAVPTKSGCLNCHYMDMKTEHFKPTAGPVSCVQCHETKVDAFTAAWDKTCEACHATRHGQQSTRHASTRTDCGDSGCHPIDDVSDIHDGTPTYGSTGSGTISTTLFAEDFESGGFGAWNASSNWTIRTDDRYAGTYSARMNSTNLCTLEKRLSVTDASNLSLSFWLKGNSNTEDSDYMSVYATSDGGATWVQVWSKTLGDRSSSWSQVTVTIPDTYATSGFGFQIRGDVSYGDEYQYVDNVILTADVPDPNSQTSSSTTGNTGCEKCHSPSVVPTSTDCGTTGCHPGLTGGHHAMHDSSGFNPEGCDGCHFTYLDDEHSALGFTCGTCHDSTSQTVQDAIVGGQRSCAACHPGNHYQTAQLMYEFNPNNGSMHRVSAELPGMRDSFVVDGRTYTWSRPEASSFLKSGWAYDSMVGCSGCHTYSGATGPHGATMQVNIDPDYPVSFADGTLTNSNSIGMQTGLLCAKCHDLNGTGSNSTWSNEAHKEHDDRGFYEGSRCISCHVAIPHGWARPRLLGSTTDPAPYTVAPNGVYRMSLRSYTPGNWDKRDCEAGCDNHHDEPVSNAWPGTVAPPPDYGTLAGRVTDSNGAGISGATVSVSDGPSATTDTNGYYTIANVKVGSYSVTASKAGYTSLTLTATVLKDLTTTLDFTLSVAPTGAVAGQVTDSSNGAAVSGASVTLAGIAVTTGSDGSYAFTGIAEGTYSITVTAVGYQDFSDSVAVTGGQTTTKNISLTPASINLALGKSFSASKYESWGYSPDKAGDGYESTYWWSDNNGNDSDTERLWVDLGTKYSVNKVEIVWYGDLWASEYRIYTSTDGSNWYRVYETSSGSSGTNTVTFNSKDARYVRVECRKTGTGKDNGYGVAEMRVFGQ